MCRKLASLLILVLMLSLSTAAWATDYYVSPSGNDNNSGTSPEEAWATIDKVNSMTFSAGDSISFEGGQTFSGSLYFEAGGTPTSPIAVSSYGTGRATISSGSENGFYAYDCAGFEITELNFVGSGRTDPLGDHGIFFFTDRASGARPEYVRIDNVDVSAYRETGIMIGQNDRSNIGFADVEITNCDVHDNGDKGISSYGFWPRPRLTWAHQGIYIGDCKIYNNTGIPGREPHSGNGIVLSGVDGAVIEYTEAYNNGELCDAPGGGPLGIWCWEANSVVMQFCESHHNKTSGGDGGGFDIDGGATNCIMQYTYSHDNHGCGYLICQFQRAAAYKNNICRYNISEGDAIASRGAMGAITFWSGGSGGINDTQICNNTLYVSDATRGAGIEVWSGGISNTAVHNNIIMTTAGKQVLNFSSTSGGWALQGNCYWSSGAPLEIVWGGTTYTSLADFRAGTGQEMLDGQPVGFEVDPCLTDPGNGGTMGDPHLLPALDAYKLKETSGLIDGGLDILALFGIDPGQQDFYGSSIPLPPAGAYDVGAHEYDANVQPDTDPPTPDPMTWETVPYATGDDSIAMEATEAFDLSGVEYYFECTGGGGHNSGWQDSTLYEDTGLSSNTTYTYRVQARDKSPNQNATAFSTEESATTDPEDTTPPTPDPMTWATVPYSTGASSITMVATTATDISGVEYYFAELSGNPGGSDSGWQDDTTYEDTGLDPNTTYTYQVKARDKSSNLNETAYSTAESATTDPAGAGELPWFDGFESGDFIAGGWTTTGTAVVKAQAKYNGSYGAEMQLVSSMETAINTSGFTDIHLKFYCKTKGLDGGEALYAEWYDGSDWHELDAVKPGGWTFYDKTCGAGANDNPSFKIRFSLIASHANEEWARIDDVEVTGTAQ